MNAILQNLLPEILNDTGIVTTPEPEELKESRATKLEIHPSNGLVCVKPRPNRNHPNRTFQRYGPELWSIIATRESVCPRCGRPIRVREEITLFDDGKSWSHFSHAVDEVPRTTDYSSVY